MQPLIPSRPASHPKNGTRQAVSHLILPSNRCARGTWECFMSRQWNRRMEKGGQTRGITRLNNVLLLFSGSCLISISGGAQHRPGMLHTLRTTQASPLHPQARWTVLIVAKRRDSSWEMMLLLLLLSSGLTRRSQSLIVQAKRLFCRQYQEKKLNTHIYLLLSSRLDL